MSDIPSPLSVDPAFEVVGICHQCEHQWPSNPFKCTAFPAGIPKEILVGDVVHTVPYPGDRGIQYKRKGGQI
jgi:hypothetical protein